jgi:2-polyprenyl-3-methyl-5-hydroxy-6-metoxy-1,4-benzoquinol methylase
MHWGLICIKFEGNLRLKMEKACRICNSKDIKAVAEIKTENLKEKDILRIIHCNNCKVSFIAGRLSEKSYGNFVEKIDDVENTDGLSYQSRIDAIENYRKLNRVLDFGCGFGGFLKEAKKHNWDAYGMDKSLQAISYVKNKQNIKNCFSIDKKLNKDFDAILLWGVIEHLDFPMETLIKLLKNLRKGGALIIYCPNASNLFYKISHFFYYLSLGKIDFFMKRVYIPEHRFYFNRESIIYLLEKGGLKIKSIRKIGINLDTIFKLYKNQSWANNFLTKSVIRLLNLMTKTHFEIICEK